MAQSKLERRKYISRRRRVRRRRGFCDDCSNKAVVPKHRCQSCIDRAAVAKRSRYQIRQKSGVCARQARGCLGMREPGRMNCRNCLLHCRLIVLKMAGLPASEIEKAERALETFENVCAACSQTSSCGDWCFDHCHRTLRFRGIVGRRCNAALGMLNDDPTKCSALARYLRR